MASPGRPSPPVAAAARLPLDHAQPPPGLALPPSRRSSLSGPVPNSCPSRGTAEHRDAQAAPPEVTVASQGPSVLSVNPVYLPLPFPPSEHPLPPRRASTSTSTPSPVVLPYPTIPSGGPGWYAAPGGMYPFFGLMPPNEIPTGAGNPSPSRPAFPHYFPYACPPPQAASIASVQAYPPFTPGIAPPPFFAMPPPTFPPAVPPLPPYFPLARSAYLHGVGPGAPLAQQLQQQQQQQQQPSVFSNTLSPPPATIASPSCTVRKTSSSKPAQRRAQPRKQGSTTSTLPLSIVTGGPGKLDLLEGLEYPISSAKTPSALQVASQIPSVIVTGNDDPSATPDDGSADVTRSGESPGSRPTQLPSLPHSTPRSTTCSILEPSPPLAAAPPRPLPPPGGIIPAVPPDLIPLTSYPDFRPSSTAMTCTVPDCPFPRFCFLSPCGDTICRDHLGSVIRGAQSETRVAVDVDGHETERVARVYECVKCHRRSEMASPTRGQVEKMNGAGLVGGLPGHGSSSSPSEGRSSSTPMPTIGLGLDLGPYEGGGPESRPVSGHDGLFSIHYFSSGPRGGWPVSTEAGDLDLSLVSEELDEPSEAGREAKSSSSPRPEPEPEKGGTKAVGADLAEVRATMHASFQGGQRLIPRPPSPPEPLERVDRSAGLYTFYQTPYPPPVPPSSRRDLETWTEPSVSDAIHSRGHGGAGSQEAESTFSTRTRNVELSHSNAATGTAYRRDRPNAVNSLSDHSASLYRFGPAPPFRVPSPNPEFKTVPTTSALPHPTTALQTAPSVDPDLTAPLWSSASFETIPTPTARASPASQDPPHSAFDPPQPPEPPSSALHENAFAAPTSEYFGQSYCRPRGRGRGRGKSRGRGRGRGNLGAPYRATNDFDSNAGGSSRRDLPSSTGRSVGRNLAPSFESNHDAGSSPETQVEAYLSKGGSSELRGKYPVVKVENIPFLISYREIEEWVPKDALPPFEEVPQPIHIILHRMSARTLPHCYVEVKSGDAVIALLKTLDRTELGGRTVRIKLERPGEFMRDLFDQGDYFRDDARADAVHILPASRLDAYSLPQVLWTDYDTIALHRLLDRPPSANSRFAAPTERPYTAIASVIAKYPWEREGRGRCKVRDALYYLALRAVAYARAFEASLQDWPEATADRLCAVASECPGFTPAQRAKFALAPRCDFPPLSKNDSPAERDESYAAISEITSPASPTISAEPGLVGSEPAPASKWSTPSRWAAASNVEKVQQVEGFPRRTTLPTVQSISSRTTTSGWAETVSRWTFEGTDRPPLGDAAASDSWTGGGAPPSAPPLESPRLSLRASTRPTHEVAPSSPFEHPATIFPMTPPESPTSSRKAPSHRSSPAALRGASRAFRGAWSGWSSTLT
ncbi:hypothetical protein JCM10212_005309 [Sporobolomyces blumeae]